MMIRIAVWAYNLFDSYLHKVTQLGADCIDGIQVPTWGTVYEGTSLDHGNDIVST